MKKNICTIAINDEAKNERLMIYWDSDDYKLHYCGLDGCEPSTAYNGEPVDDYTWETFEEAVEAADIMWGRTDVTGAWELEWIENED